LRRGLALKKRQQADWIYQGDLRNKRLEDIHRKPGASAAPVRLSDASGARVGRQMPEKPTEEPTKEPPEVT
jgi:hypothetical protein